MCQAPTWLNDALLGTQPLPRKRNSPLRWLVLTLATAALIGPYYSFDVPAATQHAMREQFGMVPSPPNSNSTASGALDTAESEFNVNFNLLYSLYSIPNVILPLFGGMLTDAFGAGRLTAVLSAAITVGAMVGYVGISMQQWSILFAGRVIFGSLESLCVSQRILVAQWFMGKELALAMGVILAVGRLGSVANDNISVLLPLDTAYLAAGVACAGSTLCAFGAVWINSAYTARREQQRRQEQEARASGLLNRPTSAGDVSRSGGAHRTASRAQPTMCGAAASRCAAVVAAVKSLDYRFYLLALVCFTGFPSVSSFNNIAASFLRLRWTEAGQRVSQARVNLSFSLVYLISAGLASPAGALVDRTGRRAVFTVLSAATVATTHLLLAFTSVSAMGMMAVLGVGFSLYAASFWPSVAYVVPEKYYGIAYGLVGCVQNSGLAAVPVMVGMLQPPACGATYACVLQLFAGLAGVAMLASLALAVAEQRDPSGTALAGACGGAPSRRDTKSDPLLADSQARAGDETVPSAWDATLLERLSSRRRSGAFHEDDRTNLATLANVAVTAEVSSLLHHTAAGALAMALAAEPTVFSADGRPPLLHGAGFSPSPRNSSGFDSGAAAERYSSTRELSLSRLAALQAGLDSTDLADPPPPASLEAPNGTPLLDRGAGAPRAASGPTGDSPSAP